MTNLYLYFCGNTIVLHLKNKEVENGWRERLEEVNKVIIQGNCKSVASPDIGNLYFTPYTFLGWRFVKEEKSLQERAVECMEKAIQSDSEGNEWKNS